LEADYNSTYQNLLFSNSIRIEAAQDGPRSEPGFSWYATGYRHVVCAVFDSPIHVQENLITNSEDAVWVWHTGLATGREGNIRFNDGVASIASLKTPVPLETGTYYWAVWALDNEGHPVASSVEYVLQVM
jgi:hypothetical protein